MGVKDVERGASSQLICKDPAKWGFFDKLSFSWMNK